MQHYQDQYYFGSQIKAADEVEYNFYFKAYAEELMSLSEMIY